MMVRIISALLAFLLSAGVAAQSDKPLEIAADAPDRHIVQKGDTLWGIAGKFLKEPWRWPEVWRMNREEIRNPHRIYPGQVVILDRSGGDPRLRLGNAIKLDPRVYAEDVGRAIPSIPQQIIEPFLSEPLIVDAGGLDASPRIIATQENRVFLGPGNVAYVSGLNKVAQVWQVYRPVRPIKDLDTGEVLGYEAFYLGVARVARDGEPAVVEILSAKQEIGAGDRLVPLVKPDIVTYAPHAPDKEVDGRVLSIYGGVSTGEAGRFQVVTVNRGRRDGLEIGHVLALYRNGRIVNYKDDDNKNTFKLPNERYGLLFVFRTFERVSYALVMEAARPLVPNDLALKP